MKILVITISILLAVSFAEAATPNKITLAFSLEQGWEGLVAADDQLAVNRIVKALDPLKKHYNVCMVVNPMLANKQNLKHTLDTLTTCKMPFILDVYSSDTFTLGCCPQNKPYDGRHGISISIDELKSYKAAYSQWLAGIRFHEIFAEDFTVRSEKAKRQGWLPADLPLPDDDFFQEKLAEPYIKFAKEHKMSVQWSDWHWLEFAPWDDVQKQREEQMKVLLRKYPGVVTVTYANNEPNEDSVKRLSNWDKGVSKFVSEGATGYGLSNQTWLRKNEVTCPVEDMIAWSESAITKGCKLIQFEPAWWFFKLPRGSSGGADYVSKPEWTDRGNPTDNFDKLSKLLLELESKTRASKK